MSRSRLGAMLSALQHRGFRAFWSGRLLARAIVQMRQVARGWLVYDLTGSALALAGVASARAIAVLCVAPVAGVLTDRLSKKTVTLVGIAAQALNSAILAALALSGHIQVWHIVVSTLVEGVNSAFLMPSQNAIVADLVPREALMNAFSSIAVAGALMGIVGAAASGQLAEYLGAGAVFALIAGIYIPVLCLYARLPDVKPNDTQPKTSWTTQWLDGVRMVRTSPALLILLLLGFVRQALIRPYSTLLPAFAAVELGMTASGLGFLTSANLVGAFLFSIALGAWGDAKSKGRMLLSSGLAMGVALLLFVSIRWIPSAFIFIAIVGGMSQVHMVLSKTLTQTLAEPQFRGRVNSLRQTISGFAPAIQLPASALADQIGVPPIVAIQAILVLLIYGGVWVLRPRFRRLP